MGLSLITMVTSILKSVATLDPETPFRPVDGLLWSTIEQSLVIIIGCIPALIPLGRTGSPVLLYVTSLLSALGVRSKSGSSSGRGRQSVPGQHPPTIGSGEKKKGSVEKDEVSLVQNEMMELSETNLKHWESRTTVGEHAR